MSLFTDQTLECPSCGHSFEFATAGSLNADRRPDLREAVLNGTYQAQDCPNCGLGLRCDPRLTYLDVGRGQWILAAPADQAGLWKDLEEGALEIFRTSFGEGAAASARKIGQRLQARVTFGWPGLREKLLCAEHGLDDSVLELVKLQLLRDGEARAFGDDNALRLVRVEPDTLVMGWIDVDADSPEELLRVQRGLYDAIEQELDVWLEPLSRLTEGPYVDVTRLLGT